jgi:hypothetical protein
MDYDTVQDVATVTAIATGRIRDYTSGRKGSRADGSRTARAKARSVARRATR